MVYYPSLLVFVVCFYFVLFGSDNKKKWKGENMSILNFNKYNIIV